MSLSVIAIVHISTGTIAILSGFTALFARKGDLIHRRAGNLFFVSMLIGTLSGIYFAFVVPVALSAVGGVLTLYLIATSWVTIRRCENQSGRFEIVAFFVALGICISGLFYGLEASASETGMKDGFPALLYYIYGVGMGAFSALCDGTVIIRGGVSGAYRIARHLWRMCFAMFVASASFFLGQPQVFPEAIRGGPLLAVPVLVVVALLFFWLFRVLSTDWVRGRNIMPVDEIRP